MSAVSASTSPPGPKGSLFLGNMREFNADSLAFITRCARDYGDFVRTRFLHQHALLLNHPDLIEYVLTTANRNFIKPVSLRTPFFRAIVGNGLVASEGEFWLRQRRLAQPAFHRERLNNYGATTVAFAGRMLDSWHDGETREIHRDMMRLTLEVVAKNLFDADVRGAASEIGDALEIVVRPFASQATLKWILDNRLPTPSNRRFHRAVRRIDEIVYRIIVERRAEGSRDRGDLLSTLLQAQDEDGTRMTDKQLRDEAMTLFLAGHETTALAMTWAWYLLAQHPAVEAQLLAELEEVLQGRAPTFADMPRLRFTGSVIKETMRLYPPGWGMGRESIEACEIGGYRVPAGSQLFMFQWVIQRDPRFFDRPEEFDPARWTDEMTKRLPKFAYFPFGGGPRLCIGNAFAMMESVLLLATIAQRFRFTLDPAHTVALFPALTLRPRNGVKVIVNRR